ncbi:hypothetical protein ACIRS1_25860 [Kitasatospora sp. NPDC101176]|uniref:hypothetical protein n=1 Tax=Kitasatospora sp. NPDC101176 TaxID=3364099 RepID=UPI0038018AE7
MQERIGESLDSWLLPFPSPESAADFVGGGPAREGWAAGLERARRRLVAALRAARARRLAGGVRPALVRDEWERID